MSMFFHGSPRRSFLGGSALGCARLALVLVLALFAGLVVQPPSLHAQSQNAGTLSGNVTDANNAQVVNATASLKSNTTGATTTVKVSKSGEYLFNDVKADTYSLSVSAPTFEGFTATAIEVNATQNVRLDVKLTRGSEDVTVNVEAPSATVDTRSATIATVIDPTLVQELPVDGNNVVELAALLPGVTNVNAPTTFTSDTGGPSYNTSGSRSNQNNFLFDGVLWNNVYYYTGLNFPPTFMLQEVSVQLVNFKAQYGRSVGSVFNAVSRSGSNKFHGTVWEYMQNRSLNAADYISHRNPHLVQNQFGATLGGPILRNKLFFFLGYQDLRSSAEVDSEADLPSLAERGLNADGSPRQCITTIYGAGATCASFAQDFSAALASTTGVKSPINGSPATSPAAFSQIQSTWTSQGHTGTSPCITALLAAQAASSNGVYLPNAEVPSVCFNPVSVKFAAKYLPLPSDPNATSIIPVYTSAIQPRNDQDGFARVDLNLGRHTLDARIYVTNVNDVTSNGVSPSVATVANYELNANAAGIYNGNIGDTWVISPTLLNVARTSYKRYNYTIVPTDTTTLIDLGSNFTDPGYPVLPRFQVNGRWQVGSGNSPYSYSVNATYEADDNLTWTHGAHNFQFGGQYLDMQYIRRYDTTPAINLGGEYTGYGQADFLMGLIYSETVGNRTDISAVDHAYYFYAQDDWRATPKLTLNLGLRYELPMPWFQPNGHSLTFIPGYQSHRFANVIPSLAYQGDPGVPNSIIKTSYSNFAPRFGVSYDIFGTGRTVLRAGFGLFYENLNANTVGIGEPYHYTASYFQPDGSLSTPMLNNSSVPQNYSGPASAVFTTPYSVNFADANVTEPYTYAVNIGVQQRILRSAVLELNYVGKFGRHQIVPYDLNPDIYDCKGANFIANPTLYCPGGPLPANPTAAQISTAQGFGLTPGSQGARVSYPGFNYGGQGIVDNNSVGTNNYNGLQLTYTQHSRSNLTTVASYTYQRSMDDQSSGTTNNASVPGTPNVNTNYGPSDFQATHVVNAGWSLRLPVLKTGMRVERAALNGWSFGGIFNARTGNPINITTSNDYELSAEGNQRPPLAAGLTHYVPLAKNRSRAAKVLEWYNACSFANGGNASGNGLCPPGPIAPGYTNGISRNYLYGPAFIETDFSLRREIQFAASHGLHAEFRADAFNVWNTVNLANPGGQVTSTPATLGNATNGNIVGTVGRNNNVGTNGRRIQMALIIRY